MVETGGLENRCTLTGTGGSNPSLSAIQSAAQKIVTDNQILRASYYVGKDFFR